jgi:TPP-dependent pyruvate/acetoin dehydrogenase alpha subunit
LGQVEENEMKIKNELMLRMYEEMVFGREFELCAEKLAHRGLVAGSIHLGIGEEAAQVGACLALAPQDYLLPSHRTHVGDLAKGTDPKILMAEIIGRKTGFCGGRAGSSHFADKSTNNLGVQGIIGAVFPVAAGAALTQKMSNSERIILAVFGEGASHQGTFHESLNLSALWKLPVVWMCINNQYAMGTAFEKTSAVANVADRACAYNIPGYVVDGNDVIAVYQAISAARQRALAGEGPTLVECKTYRHRGHSTFDKNPYRSQEEIDAWLKKDPLVLFEQKLRLENILNDDKVKEIVLRVKEKIDKAEEFAVQSPEPEPESALLKIFNESEVN